MAHRNARLTPHGRLLFCERVETGGWTLYEAASAAGVSRRTAGQVAHATAGRGHAWSARPLLAAVASPCASSPPAVSRRPAAPDEAPRPRQDRLAHATGLGDRLPCPQTPAPARPAVVIPCATAGRPTVAAASPRDEEQGRAGPDSSPWALRDRARPHMTA